MHLCGHVAQVRCAYCNALEGYKGGFRIAGITHTICPSCMEWAKNEIEKALKG